MSVVSNINEVDLQQMLKTNNCLIILLQLPKLKIYKLYNNGLQPAVNILIL